MKIVVAPDSFKGSLTSIEAASIITQAVKSVYPSASVCELPLADGGEGTLEVLVQATRGKTIETEVSGPLPKQRVNARWGFLGDTQTAVIEIAQAAGILLIPEKKRDPRITTTYGVGELIRSAFDRSAKKILIGVGGSATNDAGAGMAQARGIQLRDKHDKELGPGGAALRNLHRIDLTHRDEGIQHTEILAACDVTNTLCGPQGTSAVYGPQKGASPEDVKLLDEALHHFAAIVLRDVGMDVLTLRSGGAGGGLGAGLAAFLNAKLQSGIDLVLQVLRFEEHLRDASLVITGEGKIDEQTRFGKSIAGVAIRARDANVPVVAIGGMIDGDVLRLQKELCLQGLFSIVQARLNDAVGQDNIQKERAMRNAKELLFQKTIEVISGLNPAIAG